MPIPDYQTLMLPLLKLASTGEVKNSDAIEAMCNQFNLTEDERKELLASKTQKVIAIRFYWAIIHLNRAGLIVSPRLGVFTITDRGSEVLKQGIDNITVKYLMRFKMFEEWAIRSLGVHSKTNEVKPSADMPEDALYVLQMLREALQIVARGGVVLNENKPFSISYEVCLDCFSFYYVKKINHFSAVYAC